MAKRDPIFWSATVIFTVALLLFYLTQTMEWLILGIVSYLLRPTLASLGIAKRLVDERQMTINYHSGYVAFVTTLIACVICAVMLAAEHNHAFEYFYMVIIVGLATKALFNVLLVKNFREAAKKILIGVGLLMALFSSFSAFHPFDLISIVMNALPGLVVVGIGFLSRRHPRSAGWLILVATVFLLWRILERGLGWGQLAAAVVVCVPLAIGGICLLRVHKCHSEVVVESAQ